MKEGADRDDRRRELRQVALEAGLLGAVALALRLVNLDHTAYVDELNHVMAAASLLSEGTLLLEGTYEYTRARLFTWMVAGAYLVFGESLVAARIPAVVAGTLLVVVTFLWVRTAAGRWEGWTAGILLMLAPQAIYHSQLARFYAVQALFVVGAAWCVYALATGPRRPWHRRRVGLLAGGAVALGVAAMGVQINSLVGLAAIGGWLVAVLGLQVLRSDRPLRAYRVPAAVVGLLGGAILVWLWVSGTLAGATAAFGHVDVWARGQETNLRYYHYHLLSHYPLLWAPFPIVAVLALRRRARATSLWLAIFVLVVGAHSVAPQKASRYIFYALPFFFALTGMVVGPLLRAVLGEFRTFAGRWLGRRTAAAAAVGILAVSLVFAAWGNAAFSYTARMVVGDDAGWPFDVLYRGEADWRGVAEDLGREIREASAVVTSTELKAVYFLGRNDVILSANYLGVTEEGEPREAFSRNWKTDVPMMVRPGSVEQVVGCRPSGLILVEDNHWRQSWSVPNETADTVEALTQRVALDPGRRIHAFRWDHGDDFDPPEVACEGLPI